jgi:hypothetical protein
VDHTLSVENKAAEGFDLISEHLMRSRGDCGKVVTDTCC